MRLRNEIFDDFSKLLNKGVISKKINDNMTFSNLESNNEEILKMFSTMFIDVYFENHNTFFNMIYALKNGEIEIFEKELRKILLENVGVFDVSGSYKEQFYHGLMLGRVLSLKNEYEITSNNFS